MLGDGQPWFPSSSGASGLMPAGQLPPALSSACHLREGKHDPLPQEAERVPGSWEHRQVRTVGSVLLRHSSLLLCLSCDVALMEARWALARLGVGRWCSQARGDTVAGMKQKRRGPIC